MAEWIEVTLHVDGEAAEATAELLQRYGYQGVVIEQEGIPPDEWDEDDVPAPKQLTLRAYFPDDARAEETRSRLDAALGHMNMMYPMPTPSYRTLAEDDWAEAWKAHYHPVRIGRRLFVRPLWIQTDFPPDLIELALDPGMAFGTGTHPTTQLCLEALEDLTPPGGHVLDLGCGSGILAIAAAKLGAAHVLALDIDPIAVEASRVNVAQNGVADRVTVDEGSLANVITSARRFDLVVANILARVIIVLCGEHLGEAVRPGGRAIFSGIIDTQADDVETALRSTGLEPYARRQMGDWVVIEARRAAE